MSAPQMRKWVYHCAKRLLDDLDDVPLSDDSIDKKLAILRAGLREASVELFKRAAVSSTAEILESKEYQLISKKPTVLNSEKMFDDSNQGKTAEHSKQTLSEIPSFRKI